MAKSIRSKAKKRARSEMRSTIGAAQAQKDMRKVLRRLRRTVDESSSRGGAGALSAVHAALAGTAAGSSSSGASASAAAGGAGAGGASAGASIAVPSGPPRTKALRYTFNSALRATRIEADLEDLTDDEEDVRFGRVRAASEASEGEMVDAEAAAALAVARGDKFLGRALSKPGAFKPHVSASVGFYASDPIFAKPKDKIKAKRLAARREAEAAAAPALAAAAAAEPLRRRPARK